MAVMSLQDVVYMILRLWLNAITLAPNVFYHQQVSPVFDEQRPGLCDYARRNSQWKPSSLTKLRLEHILCIG